MLQMLVGRTLYASSKILCDTKIYILSVKICSKLLVNEL